MINNENTNKTPQQLAEEKADIARAAAAENKSETKTEEVAPVAEPVKS